MPAICPASNHIRLPLSSKALYFSPMKLADFPFVKTHVPLKAHCTFGVGGPADYFADASTPDELQNLLYAARLEEIPVFVMGGGSNVLFRDEGFRGLVVRLAMNTVRVEGTELIADAGAKWPAVLRVMEEAHLTGLEPFAGLPGTVGGAVVGNAGCFGLEIKDVIAEALVLNQAMGSICSMDKSSFGFFYRSSGLKKTHDIVLQATFQLSHRSTDSISTPSAPISRDTLRERATKQPPGKSSGSFFKNPFPNDSTQPTAGQLIDQCGLKGFQIGGAQISSKHGNFFMNTGSATAADILALRDHAKKAVLDRFEIELHEEVVIVF